MKASIVTFVRAYNHGALLQTYALHAKLNELGIDSEVLDYYPQFFKDVYLLTRLGKLRFFPYRPLSSWKKYAPMLWVLNKRVKGFENFIAKNIKLSPKQYLTKQDVQNENFEYDAFISGSDQVWNHKLTDSDPVFFLDFDSAKKTKRWSYAASFGFKQIPEGFEDRYKTWLSGWDKYSVREARGCEILKEVTGEVATQCCDPTILLTKEQWEKVKSPKKHKKPYIFIYYVNSNKEVLAAAKKLADEKNLDIITVTSATGYEHLMGTDSKQYNAKHKGSAAPDDFISLVAGAEYVLTDSFHGTVFSLIYHKKFLTLTELSWGYVNSRALELLDLVGENKRVLGDDILMIDTETDWEKIDRILEEYRKKSIKYIKTFR